MRFQRVSNSMVRANLNVMGRPARKILSNYAREKGIPLEEATRKVLGFIREFERRSSMEIFDEPSFTPFVTFVGIKQPNAPIFRRAVSSAEHGRIPVLPKKTNFRTRPMAKRTKFDHIKLQSYLIKHAKELYKKPITRAEFLENKKSGMGGGAYKYCTAYSNDCIKEAIRFLEKKPASTNVLSKITHEVREISDPYISSETSIHKGTDPKDKRIAVSVYHRLQKEYK